MRRLRLVALVVALGSPVLAQPSYAPQGWASPPNPYASAPTYAAPAPAAPPVAPAEVNDPVAEAESEKVRLEAEVAALAEQRAHTEESLRARARALYRLRRSGMLPVAGGFEALLGHLSRVERLERMVSRDVRSSRFLRQREESLRAELSLADGRIAEARREAEAQRARAAEQAAATAAFQNVFDPRMLPALPVAPLPPMQHGTFRVHGSEPTSGFGALRGRLPLPVRGGGAMREASREDGRGIEVLSPAGSPVVSVADGRVAFAGRYGTLGQTIVLDHGDGHYTLYAGLARTGLAVGEWVGQGALLGNLGGEPLYFEVREGTRSVDTRGWLGL
ncbi:MAG: peptidoglycan DD-metalloendopeptidase family protein [Sandaracinus sp.]|nr:peptidoglycan DD-metalloendopeptidase family protein [Sandaracinus sp.]MCB9619441.1 peptidoglycan DD-metalloendopeptidase family protein [Sandaracinus sp.]